MRHTLSATFFCCFLQVSLAQEISVEKLEDALSDYTAKIEHAAVLQDCGHAFDGPAFFYKQMENNWLDFALNISSDSKKNIGRDMYNRYVALGQLDNNHFAKPKVEEILQRIVKNVSRNDVSYRISILKSEEINAFATLGGYLYITTGLLNFVDSYDELAFIIGHEVAHELVLRRK